MVEADRRELGLKIGPKRAVWLGTDQNSERGKPQLSSRASATGKKFNCKGADPTKQIVLQEHQTPLMQYPSLKPRPPFMPSSSSSP